MDKEEVLEKLYHQILPRIKTLSEIPSKIDYIFEPYKYDKELLTGNLSKEICLKILLDFRDRINSSSSELESWFRCILTQRYSLRMKDVIRPVRIALSGREVTLPLFSVINVLGLDECNKRIEYAIKLLLLEDQNV